MNTFVTCPIVPRIVDTKVAASWGSLAVVSALGGLLAKLGLSWDRLEVLRQTNPALYAALVTAAATTVQDLTAPRAERPDAPAPTGFGGLTPPGFLV